MDELILQIRESIVQLNVHPRSVTHAIELVEQSQRIYTIVNAIRVHPKLASLASAAANMMTIILRNAHHVLALAYVNTVYKRTELPYVHVHPRGTEVRYLVRRMKYASKVAKSDTNDKHRQSYSKQMSMVECAMTTIEAAMRTVRTNMEHTPYTIWACVQNYNFYMQCACSAYMRVIRNVINQIDFLLEKNKIKSCIYYYSHLS